MVVRIRSIIGRSVRYVAIVGGFFTVRASGPHPHCGSEDQELTSYERTSATVAMDAVVGVVVTVAVYIY